MKRVVLAVSGLNKKLRWNQSSTNVFEGGIMQYDRAVTFKDPRNILSKGN